MRNNKTPLLARILNSLCYAKIKTPIYQIAPKKLSVTPPSMFLNYLNRSRCALVALILIATSFIANPAHAIDEAQAEAQAEAAVLQAISQGRSAEAAIAAWQKTQVTNGAKVRSTPRTDSAELVQQLDALKTELAKPTATPETIKAAAEKLQAALMLWQANHITAKERIIRDSLPPEFLKRATDIETMLIQPIERALALILAPPLEVPQANPSKNSAKQAAENSTPQKQYITPTLTPESRQSAANHLAPLIATPRAAILGASVLPVRSLNLPVRAPTLTPVIQPSYLNTTDVVALPEDQKAGVEGAFSEELLTVAKSLNYDYVKIFEYVRNQIKTEWYAGAMKGAIGTLRSKAGNDVDQAILLVALMRASGAPARYVHGVIELPVEQVAQDLGLTDATLVPDALARAGVAYTPINRGGRVALVQVEHTWVTVQIPYTNYRGVIVDATGKTWLPVDTTVKVSQVNGVGEALRQLNLNVDTIIAEYNAAVQSNDLMKFMRDRITSSLGAANPLAAQLASSVVTPQLLGLLPNTLPYNTIAIIRESATLDSRYIWTAGIKLYQDAAGNGTAGFDIRVPIYELANFRTTLDFIPATLSDHRISLSWGGLDYVPSYLITLRPQLRIDGKSRFAGQASVRPGDAIKLEITLSGPSGDEVIEQKITAGALTAMGVGFPNAQRPNSVVGDQETQAAALLDGIAVKYATDWKNADNELSAILGVPTVHARPTVTLVSLAVAQIAIAQQPLATKTVGVQIDALTRTVEPIGTDTTRKNWLKLSALHGSSLEHTQCEVQFRADAVSADKVFALAKEKNIALLNLTAANVDAQLATTNHATAVKTDVKNWIRLGYTVAIPTAVITRNIWTGSAWRVEDSATGAAGYFISGSLAGGSTTEPFATWTLQFLADAFEASHTPEPNPDVLSAAEIERIAQGDNQQGIAGKALDKNLGVKVLDIDGRPVKGARVKFKATAGGGRFPNGTAEYIGISNALGIVQTGFELGKKTKDSPIFADLKKVESDKFTYIVGYNAIDVSVDTRVDPNNPKSREGSISAGEPFSAYALPGNPRKVVIGLKDAEAAPLNPDGSPPLPKDIVFYGDAGHSLGQLPINVEDEYGNPIANVEINATVGVREGTCPVKDAPINAAVYAPKTCTITSPLLGECGGDTALNISGVYGAATIGVILGNVSASTYPVTFSANGFSAKAKFKSIGSCSSSAKLIVQSSSLLSISGDIINASKIGTEFKFPIQTILTYTQPKYTVVNNNINYFADTTISRVNRVGSIVYDVSNAGSALPVESRSIGVWDAKITTGTVPEINAVTADIKNASLIDNVTKNGAGQIVYDVPRDISWKGVINSVFGVKPEIDKITSINVPVPVDEKRIYLDSKGFTQYASKFDYTVYPKSYSPVITTVEIAQETTPPAAPLKTGEKIFALLVGSKPAAIDTLETTNKTGIARLAAGSAMDINRIYKGTVVLNENTPAEVRSTEVELPLRQRLISSYTKVLRLVTDIDVFNDRSCNLGADFIFKLSQPAKVTLKFQPYSDVTPADGSEPTLVGVEQTVFADVVYDTEEQTYSIRSTDLLPRKNGYRLTINAVAVADAQLTETERGRVLATFDANDALAMGNVIIKGVNLKSGRYVQPGQSIQLIGRGPQMAFRPMYSSAGGGRVGQLGANWSHNLDSNINITRCGDVIVSTGDTGAMRFIPVTGGGFTAAKGYHGTLVANQADKSFDFYSKDGTQYHFDFFATFKGWRVTSISDTNGNKLKLTVNALSKDGLVKEIEDASGRIMSITHESRNFDKTGITASVITAVTAPGGISLKFTYDDFGNLITSRREQGLPASNEAYAYSTDAGLMFVHNLTAFTNANGKISTIDYKIGTADFKPEGATSPVSVPNATVQKLIAPDNGITAFTIGAGPSETTSIVTDARNKPTTYVLNKTGSATRITDPAGTTSMTWSATDVLMLSRTDANGSVTTYSYDPHGNLIAESVNGLNVLVTTSQTWLVQPTAPFIKNRVLSRTDRRGNITTYTYDNKGNLVAENRPLSASFVHTYAANGDRLSATDANGKITQIRYNALGLPEAIVNPLTGTTALTYDLRGRMLSTTDAEGRTTAFVYNNLDHLISTTNALSGLKQSTYDALGNKLTETDEAGRSMTYVYDDVNRLLSITNPLSSPATKTLNYDKTGNKISETDWQGNSTSFTYDDANRLTLRTEPLSKTTTYTYDAVGNLLTQKDANGGTTTYIYDGLNRRTKTTNALNGITTMVYDAASNPVSTTDAAGRTTTTSYDALNRATKVEAPLSATTQATYDPAGNVLTQTDANGKLTTHKYDDLNRRISTTNALDQISRTEYDKVGNITKATDPKGKVQQWNYDNLNRRLIYQDQERNQTTYLYDAVGNKISEGLANGNTITHSYDQLNRLIASNDSLGALSSTDYDFNGNITAQTDANGNRTSHSYDQLNRKTASSLPASRSMSYSYDAVGNVTSQSDTANINTTTHVYDKLNRRTRSTDSLGTLTTITYDAVGNITSQTDPVGTLTTHTIDQLNRRTNSTDSLGTVTTASYDANGNITTQTDPKGQATATTYDALNRPTTVTHAGSPVSSTEYDEAGNVRFMTDALGNKTGYEYDGRHLNTSINQSLAVITTKRYDSMGNLTYTADSENRTTVIDYDQRNRPTTTKIGNNETTTNTYDGNGNKLKVTHPNGNSTTMSYDGANRLTTIATPAAGTSTLAYDKNSNLTTRTNGAGASTTYSYDARNRRTSITTPSGSTGSATESFTYDANGNLKTWTDANGTIITHSYDTRNRLTNKAYASSNPIGSSGNADGLSNISFTYDANGNITQTTETYAATPTDTSLTPTLAGIAGSTRTHTKRYDSFNRLDKETDPWGNTLSHSYDAQGNLKATTATTVGTNQTSRTATYQYDAINRRTNTNAGGASTAISYDRSSLPTKISYGNGAISTTEYDSAGRTTAVSHTANGTPVETTTYGYDSNGNRTTETVTQHADSSNSGNNNAQPPETRTTSYSYDSDDRLTNTTQSVTSTLVASGSITPAQVAAAVTEAASRSYSVAYSYDAAGNRVSEIASNGSNPNAPSYSKTYTLNPRNQITQIVQTGGSGANYGATAQPTATGGSGGTATTGNQGSNTLITPPLLVQTNGTTTLQYDGNGNLTQKVFVPAPATGGSTPTGPPGSGTAALNAAPVATTTQYRWNVRDGLSLVSTAVTGQPQTAVGQYRYTPEGLRDVKRAVNPIANGTTALVERRSLWRMGASGKGSADFAYLDTDANNNLLGQYESHPNGRSALQRIDSAGSSTYLHADALGSQTHTSNGSGAGGGTNGTLASTTQYDAFGNIVSQSGANNTSGNNSNPSTDSKFGYTGHEADAESGLVYFKARYYDPQLGRFIGADAMEGMLSNPMTWNGYGYANGNPLVYIDVDGNESLREMSGIDDKSVDAEHAANAGKNSGWDLFTRAAKYATKKALYAVVSISGGGFVSRQDDRREKYDAGKISEASFDKGTAIDLTVSVVAVATGGAAGGKAASLVTGKVSEKAVAAISGAAFAGTANAVEQSGQVLTYAATDGQLGQQYINPTEVAVHTAGGAILGAGIHVATPYVQKSMEAIEGGIRSVTSSITGRVTGESNKIGIDAVETLTAKSVPPVSSMAEEQGIRAASNMERSGGSSGHQYASNTSPASRLPPQDIVGPHIELGSKEALAASRVYQQALNSRTEMVIGRRPDTAAGSELGMRRLHEPDWTPYVNDAWIQGGINSNKSYYLGSNISIKNLRTHDPFFPLTIFHRELKQLRDAGYSRQGDYMRPTSTSVVVK